MSGNFFRLRGADRGMLVPVPVICNIHSLESLHAPPIANLSW